MPTPIQPQGPTGRRVMLTDDFVARLEGIAAGLEALAEDVEKQQVPAPRPTLHVVPDGAEETDDDG